MVDALTRSTTYRPELYVVERQPNPYNVTRSRFHAVVPDLNVGDVARIAKKFRRRISFGLTDTEDFVIAGGRDVIERESGVEMVCVAKKYAVERSKAEQRLLFGRIFEEANPRFKVFDPRRESRQDALSGFKRLAAEMKRPVIKPDAPTRGAGVGVWGDDFTTQEEMASFFVRVFSKGRVVVEEKVEGEESSFQAFSDGKHFVPVPLTRDYKRALDGNKGRLTGGMGSYSSSRAYLPFIGSGEWDDLKSAEEAAFRRWKGRGSDPGLRGLVLYDAVMHTGRGFKVLERNSRGGNTEFINTLTTMADDFAEVCLRVVEGSLRGIRFRREASVVTCAVPLSYGTESPPEGGRISLTGAEREGAKAHGKARVLPMDIRLEGEACLMGPSRSVAAVGLSKDLTSARSVSLKVVSALKGPLRWRSDVASEQDIRRSRTHLSLLRSAPDGLSA